MARALAQMRAAAEASAADQHEAASPWVDFIGAVLGSGKTAYLGLLLHDYGGSLESHFTLADREPVHASAVTAEMLGHMKEDVLYMFQP